MLQIIDNLLRLGRCIVQSSVQNALVTCAARHGTCAFARIRKSIAASCVECRGALSSSATYSHSQKFVKKQLLHTASNYEHDFHFDKYTFRVINTGRAIVSKRQTCRVACIAESSAEKGTACALSMGVFSMMSEAAVPSKRARGLPAAPLPCCR